MTIPSTQLAARLQTLKQQRREREIEMREYYQALLELLSETIQSLTEEVDTMSDEEVALQAPLVVLFLEEQVRKFSNRTS